MKQMKTIIKQLFILLILVLIPNSAFAVVSNLYIDDPASITEGDSGTSDLLFTVRTGGTPVGGDVTVNFTVTPGTALYGTDYTVQSGTATIKNGTASTKIAIPIVGDLIQESASKNFTVTITPTDSETTISRATATGTILDNDTRSLSINDVTVTEGTDANAVLTVTLTGNTASVDLPFTFSTGGGNASSLTDYTPKSNVPGFIPHGTSSTTISIPILNDSIVESTKTFNVTLGGSSIIGDGTGVVTLKDDDKYTVTASPVSSLTALEDSGAKTINVTISQIPLAGDSVTVNYNIPLSGTLTSADFTATSGSVTFTSATPQTQAISIGVKADTDIEPDEPYTVNFTATGGTMNTTSLNGIILNDDSPTVSISAVNSPRSETDGTMTFKISLSTPPSSGDVTGTYYTEASGTGTGFATAGSDYTAVPSTAYTLNAGNSYTQTFTVPILHNTEQEPTETFNAKITVSSGASPGTDTATGTITDVDGSYFTITGDQNVDVPEGDIGTKDATYIIELHNSPLATTCITYAVAGVTTQTGMDKATSGTDFTFTAPDSGSKFCVNAGATGAALKKTLTVVIQGDTTAEKDEAYQVSISNPTAGATISGQTSVIGIIRNDDSPIISIDSPNAVYEGNKIKFTITLSAKQSKDVFVDYKTVDGTAQSSSNPVDFTKISTTTAKISAGSTSTTFQVSTNNDSIEENSETFTVELSNPKGADISSTAGVGTGTILDNDSRTITITPATNNSVAEGNSGVTLATYSVVLSGSPMNAVSVHYTIAGPTADNTDFNTATYPLSGTVNFPANATGSQLTQTITVPINGDTTIEPDETYSVTLDSPTNASFSGGATTISASGTILNDDTSISIADAAVTEPPCPTDTVNAVLTVTLAQPVHFPITVYYTTSPGTATPGADYNGAGGQTTILAGDTNGTINIPVYGDTNNAEGPETFYVNLTTTSPAGILITDNQAMVTIADNLDYTITGFTGGSVTEGDIGTVDLPFTITLCQALSSPVTINYTKAGSATPDNTGSHAAGTDYDATQTSVTIPANTLNYTFNIPVYGDLIPESDETVILTLAATAGVNLTDNQAMGKIYDDDTRTISINNATVPEGDTDTTAATLRISMSKAAAAPVTVYYSTKNGSATAADSDYTPKSDSWIFLPGDLLYHDVTFDVIGDTKVEGDETFDVNISTPSGVPIANPGYGTVTIRDDDNRTLSFSGTNSYLEGNSGTKDVNLTVNLTKGGVASSSPVDRQFRFYTTPSNGIIGSGAKDFDGVASPGTLITIPANQTSFEFPVTKIYGDYTYEGDETFSVTMVPVDPFGVSAPFTVTIQNDDGNLSINNPAAVVEGDIGDKNVTFTVTLSRPMSIPVAVNWATSDWEATASPTGYAAASGMLTFNPSEPLSQDINVTIHGDTLYEPGNQRFKVTLTSPQGLTLTNSGYGAGVGVGSITDDDARTISINSPSYIETEGNVERDFNITMNNAMVEDLILGFSTADGTGSDKAIAGSDYNATSGSITIPHGYTSVLVPVTIFGDYTSEQNEKFTMSLTSARTGITLPAPGTMTILNDDGNLSIVSSVSQDEGNSSSLLMPFKVTLSPGMNSTVYVNYSTKDGTATHSGPNKDYEETNGTLTFIAGDTEKTIYVPVYGDTVYEGDEYFDLNISNTQGVTINNATSHGNIIDDDSRTISIDDQSVDEGDAGDKPVTFNISLSMLSGNDVIVGYTVEDGSAHSPTDYNATNGTVTIPHGTLSVPIVPITIKGNLKYELDKTVKVTITSLSSGFTVSKDVGILQILNDDGVLRMDDSSILEGNISSTTTKDVNVTLTHTSTVPIVVNYTMVQATGAGAATANVDYVEKNGTVTIPVNSLSAPIPVTIIGDSIPEGDEYFTIHITNDQNVTVDKADGTVTIRDDDLDEMKIFDHQRDFALRYGRNIYGNYTTTGAPIMCALNDSGTACDWNRNGYLASALTQFLHDDSNTSFTNSSSADLNITMATGDKILWAGLYWQGHIESNVINDFDSNTTGWNTIYFKTPNGNGRSITADLGDVNQTSFYGFKTSSYDPNPADDFPLQPGFRFFYQGYADVTEDVNKSLSTNSGRTFTVANMKATVGAADHDINDPAFIVDVNATTGAKTYGSGAVGHFGGWSLVVVYEKGDHSNPDDLRNVSIFDGYKYLVASNNNPDKSVDINVSGFRTPSSVANGASIDSTLLYFGGGSEKNIARDELDISNKSNIFSVVSNTKNPSDNPFNDTISLLGNDLNSIRIYNPGIDLDNIQVGQYLDKNQTKATIRLTAKYRGTTSDQAFAGMVGFSTQLYQPQLCYDFTYEQNALSLKNIVGDRDLPTIHGHITPGDTITAGIYLKNTDSDFDIKGLSLYTDMNASKIHYIAPSTKVTRVNGVTYGSVLSETSGGCSYTGSSSNQACQSAPNIRVGIGSNASGYTKDTAGSLGSGDYVYTEFQLNPNGMAGDVNESLGLKLDYYIDLDNNDGQIQYVYALGKDIKLCPAQTTYTPQWGMFNVVDHNDSNNLGTYYNLYTQVAKKPFTADVAFYGKDSGAGNYTSPPDVGQEVNTTVMVEIIKVDTYNDLNASCGNPHASISTPIFVDINATHTDNTQEIPLQLADDYNFASKNAAYRVWWFDTGSTAQTELAQNWAATTTGSSNGKYTGLTGINGLFTSQHTLCKTAAACGVNGETNTSVACFNCLKDNYTHPICSRDNFSIRPEAFDIRIRDINQSTLGISPHPSLLNISEIKGYVPSSSTPTVRMDLASGYQYRYDAQATNNVDLNGTPGYTAYFNESNSSFYAGLDWNSSATGCVDINGTSFVFNIINGVMADGNATMDQIGEYRLSMLDKEWTSVDWRDITHHTAGFLSGTDCTENSNSVPLINNSSNKIGCNISTTHANTTTGQNYIDPLVTLHPYDFDVTNISFSRGISNFSLDTAATARNFIYMSDINATSDMNMSFKASGLIAATNYKGNKVSNFTTGCYARDINISVNRTNVTDQNSTKYLARIIDGAYDSKAAVIGTAQSNLFILNDGNFTQARLGDTNTTLLMNYEHNTSVAVNPMRINFTNYNVSCKTASECTFAADGNASMETIGVKDMGFGVTHYYGRAQGVDSRVKTTSATDLNATGNIRVNFEIYCNKDGNTTLLPKGANTPRSDDIYWYKNTDHNTTNDGKADDNNIIDQKSGNTGHLVVDNNLQTVNGVSFITTEGVGFQLFGVKYDGNYGYPYTTIMRNTPSGWLVYDPKGTHAGLNEFTLEFYKASAWVGQDKSGTSTDSDASVNPSRRIMW